MHSPGEAGLHTARLPSVVQDSICAACSRHRWQQSGKRGGSPVWVGPGPRARGAQPLECVSGPSSFVSAPGWPAPGRAAPVCWSVRVDALGRRCRLWRLGGFSQPWQPSGLEPFGSQSLAFVASGPWLSCDPGCAASLSDQKCACVSCYVALWEQVWESTCVSAGNVAHAVAPWQSGTRSLTICTQRPWPAEPRPTCGSGWSMQVRWQPHPQWHLQPRPKRRARRLRRPGLPPRRRSTP